MKLDVGGTSIEIPDDLIDCQDFALVALKVAPQSIHRRGNEIDVRMNWGAGNLDKIGKRLKSYEDIVQIAQAAGCRKIGSVSVRLAEMYLNPDMWLESEMNINFESSMLKDMAVVLSNPDAAKESSRVAWKESGCEDEFGPMEDD